jgi:hypothetical protein
MSLEKPNSAVICIIGMHRSGTSMIARLLQQCGLYLGPADRLLGSSGGNPLGHFEHTGFLQINEELLAHLKGSAFDPPRFAADWERDMSLAPFFARAKELVDGFRSHSLWGWKEPRTTLLLPFWRRLIPNLRFVVCVRNPMEVGESVMRRGIGSFQKGVWLWNEYTRSALRETRGYPRRIVFYEDFLAGDKRQIRNLVEFCGLAGAGEAAECDNAVAGGLRHHTAGIAELLQDERALLEAKLLYAGLRSLVYERLSNGPGGSASSATDAGIEHLLELLRSFVDDNRMAQLHTAVTLKELEIEKLEGEKKRIAQDKDRLVAQLAALESTLFWKLFTAAGRFKDQYFPVGTERRARYDRFLRKLKSL